MVRELSGRRTRQTEKAALMVVVLTGCSAPSYRADIQSDDPNERILAIRAAAEASDQFSVPLLVDRLEDEDSGVRFFAIGALERITGHRFGYDYATSSAERAAAVARWREFVAERGHAEPQEASSSDSPALSRAGGGVSGTQSP